MQNTWILSFENFQIGTPCTGVRYQDTFCNHATKEETLQLRTFQTIEIPPYPNMRSFSSVIMNHIVSYKGRLLKLTTFFQQRTQPNDWKIKWRSHMIYWQSTSPAPRAYKSLQALHWPLDNNKIYLIILQA